MQRETLAPTIAIVLGIATTMSACGPRVEDSGNSDTAGGSTSSADESTNSTSGEPETTTPGTSASPVTSAGPGSTGMDTGDVTTDAPTNSGFIYGSASTGVIPPIECSTWDQDCSDGEKCTPWANDGGEAWTATHCVPLDPEAHAPGERCQVEGNVWAGIDDCDVGLLCWFVDPKTNEGTCVPLCINATDPSCEARGTACLYESPELAGLCLPLCDPKAPECPEGQTCLAAPDGQNVCG